MVCTLNIEKGGREDTSRDLFWFLKVETNNIYLEEQWAMRYADE